MKKNIFLLFACCIGICCSSAIHAKAEVVSFTETTILPAETMETQIETVEFTSSPRLFQQVQKQTSNNEEYYLSTKKESILINDSHKLSVYNVNSSDTVTFKANNADILNVHQTSDTACEFTGISTGTTTITVKIKESGTIFFGGTTTTLKCKVTVSPRAVSVKFQKPKVSIKVGQKRKLGLTLRPSITKEIPEFTSSNSRIVTISKKGQIRGKKKGIAYIYATISNGKIARCKVTVIKDSKKK